MLKKTKVDYAKGLIEHMEGLLPNGKSIAGLLGCVTTVGGDSAPARGNP